MLYLFLAIAAPSNLLGIGAIVYGIRGKSAGVATVVAIAALLGAAMTTSLAVFETAALSRLADNRLFEADEQEAREIRELEAHTARSITLLGIAGSVLPWLGAAVCFRRARRLDD